MSQQELWPRANLWRRVDMEGTDSCLVSRSGNRYLVSGTAIFLAMGDPAKLDYHICCDENWCSRSVTIRGWIRTDARSWELARSCEARWTINREDVAEFDGLTDIDLGFTPATNTIALNRLQLQHGSVVETTAVWLDPDDWSLKPLTQIYQRLSDSVYRYTSPLHDYHADLVVDDAGLVQSYPGLWQAISTWSVNMP